MLLVKDEEVRLEIALLLVDVVWLPDEKLELDVRVTLLVEGLCVVD